MNVVTLFGGPLFDSEKYQYRLKFIEYIGEPRVGISTFCANKGQCNSGKKLFYISREACKCFMEAVGQFDEDEKRGATLIGSTQISLSNKKFAYIPFTLFYKFLLV